MAKIQYKTNSQRENEMARKIMTGIYLALLTVMQTGCSNAHEDAAEAAADVSRQKEEILEDYKECLKANPSDKKACESYKEAVEAM